MINKNILITGGAGFIGSNLILYLLNKYNNYKIINLDSLTYAANLNNLQEINNSLLLKNYEFVKGDIADQELVRNIFSKYHITDVIHLAAESHVDNSIANPEIFITTNILGTYNLLNTANKHWMTDINLYKPEFKTSRFHHISTDEVYGSLGNNGLFTEKTPYAPNSPYSASKASSDFIVRSYHHTYGMNIVTTNCSNNYGPRQHSEKLIPVVIKNALNLKPIPIYGNGTNVRDWLYVEDHCAAIDTVFHHAIAGDTYNVGGNCEKTNIEIVNTICDLLNILKPIQSDQSNNKLNISQYNQLITFVKDRPGHDLRYAIDASKLKYQLNWEPQTKFSDGLTKTIMWYLNNL